VQSIADEPGADEKIEVNLMNQDLTPDAKTFAARRVAVQRQGEAQKVSSKFGIRRGPGGELIPTQQPPVGKWWTMPCVCLR
jgi:hypothetical protein